MNEEARERGVEEAELQLEKVLPELTEFCDYVRKFFVDAVGEKKGSKEADADETENSESPRKRKWADDPSFMKIKLSEDSDSEVEREKAR